LEDKELLQFLTEEKLFWVMTNGYPEFDETQLLLPMNVFYKKQLARSSPKQGNSVVAPRSPSVF
jgi:hypothetical protein